MLLVALTELLDGPIMLRAHDGPEADPALIDDHGSLASARQAGAARLAAGAPLWRGDRVLARRGERAELPET